jgi:hypothetical protein
MILNNPLFTQQWSSDYVPRRPTIKARAAETVLLPMTSAIPGKSLAKSQGSLLVTIFVEARADDDAHKGSADDVDPYRKVLIYQACFRKKGAGWEAYQYMGGGEVTGDSLVTTWATKTDEEDQLAGLAITWAQRPIVAGDARSGDLEFFLTSPFMPIAATCLIEIRRLPFNTSELLE